MTGGARDPARGAALLQYYHRHAVNAAAPGLRTQDVIRDREEGELCVLVLQPAVDNAIRDWTGSPATVRIVSEQAQLTFRT